MYYLFYNRKSKKVEHLSKEPLKKQLTDYYGEAEFYGELPTKYDYLTITHLEEKTDIWTEKEQVEKLNEKNEIVIEEIEVQKSRTYNICELVANFRPAKTEEQLLQEKQQQLRKLREAECFALVNRGELWYNRLTEEQKTELEKWYQAWLDVTETLTIPNKPNWLK